MQLQRTTLGQANPLIGVAQRQASTEIGNEAKMHIGIFAKANNEGGHSRITYRICFGRKRLLTFTQGTVALLPALDFWQPELAERHGSDTRPSYLGYINYEYGPSRRVATIVSYYPKIGVEQGAARGLPYHIELLTTQNIKKWGFTHLVSPITADSSRVKQLRRVGLPSGRETKIEDWMLGLIRGIESVTGKKYEPSK